MASCLLAFAGRPAARGLCYGIHGRGGILMEILLEQSHKLILGQQQRQSLHILQMDAAQLNTYLMEHALENPFVEYRPCLSTGPARACREHEALPDDYLEAAKQGESGTLREYLAEQLMGLRLSPMQRRTMQYLIDSLDARGYLCLEADTARAALRISASAFEESLCLLQSLEPIGVGARDLRECLLLQLRREKDRDMLAETLVRGYLSDIAKGGFARLAELNNASEEEILRAIEHIRDLNPKPGNGFSPEEDTPYSPPDIFVERAGNELRVLMNPALQFDFYICSDYAAAVRQSITTQEERAYLRERMRMARWICHGLARREHTLLRCGQIIIERQKGFFLEKDINFAPHTMRELAAQLSLNVSTVSRALNGKTLRCEWGTFPLSAFFVRPVSAMNEGISAAHVQERIKALLLGEDPALPYSDRKIAALLAQEQIFISRRAVAKYRETMFVAPSYSRRQTSAVRD